MMQESDDEEGQPLVARAFVRWIDEEIGALQENIIVPGKTVDEYNLLRGRIISLRKAKEVFLNKK